jgi:tetratricopeptide (TPR) repeat protein
VYSILLSLSLSLLLGFSGVFLDWWHWAWGIVFTVLSSVVIWILIARRIGKQIQPAMEQVQRQMQQGHVKLAIQTLEDMLPLGKWVPMLRGQVIAQMGMLEYYQGNKDRGVELLEGASVRNADARLLLGCIRFKSGETDRAFSILNLASKVSKKHPLLHNTYAWMLQKAGKAEQAQAVLAAFLKKDANNGPTKDNMLRLQNKQRMNMSQFDMQWYALGLESPPSQMGMQMRRAPKGFREPPKKKKGG